MGDSKDGPSKMIDVWCAENLAKQSDYHLGRTLINIQRKFTQSWDIGNQIYWTTYYNKVEEELIRRGVL